VINYLWVRSQRKKKSISCTVGIIVGNNKEYIKSLEDKVEKLESQVCYLSDQLNKYKFKVNMSAIGEDKDLLEIREIHEYGTKELIQSLKDGSDQKDLREKIRNLGWQVGTAGDARQRLLKSTTRLIIENIVPERVRWLFKIWDMQANYTPKEYEELWKMKKKHAENLLQSDKYNENDRMHYAWGVKYNVIELVWKLNNKTKAMLNKFKEALGQLVRVRNRLLQLQWEFRNSDKPYDYGLTPENIVSFMEYTEKLMPK